MDCEVCGESGASKTAEVEGTEFVVCDTCSSLGEVKKDLSKRRERKKRAGGSGGSGSHDWRSSLPTASKEVLRRNYGKLVREAREEMGLTMEELAGRLSEKESVVRRIENEELRPDEDMSKKLRRELEIELFEEPERASQSFEGEGDDSLTIGDVAKVK